MKSSTLHRSNLSKERMALLEELRAKSSFKEESNPAPNVYIRPSKEKELDVLWQNFKVGQKSEKSPGVYLTVGFIAGAVCMFLMTALLSFSSDSMSDNSSSTKLVKREKPAKSQISIIPADNIQKPAPTSSETYTIKSGDTLEGIIIRFYGKYDPSKVTKLMEANQLSNPNALSIGQTLTIPLD